MNAQRLKEPSLTVKKVTTRTDTTISSKCTRCGSRRNTLSVDDSAEEESAIDNVSVFAVGTPQVRPIVVKIAVNGTTIEMEVDTEAAVSLVSERTWKQIRGQVKLRKADVVLRAYNHMRLKVLGEAELQVQYGGRRYELLLRVVKEDGPSLIGRDWLQQIKLDWSAMCHWISPSQSDQMVKTLMRKYADVFKAELGTMKGVKAKLVLKAGVVPRFIRPRPIPFALKEAVEQEIRHLEEQGILRRITHSSWAAPIVVVPKKDGRVRLCGDYKMTINQYLEVDRYPLPKPNDLFATLAGGQKFSKIDLSRAYQQLVLEEESCELVVINTHIGLFSYTRLPFGVASAPALFQRAMDSILQGIAGVICYIDDILVTGKDDAQHLQALEQVLSRLQEAGLTIQKNKCVFMAKSVEYLGHVVDAEGLHTTPEKLKAILEAPAPKDLNQMRSFLGLVNYYARFIPNLSTVLHPLNRLLRQDVSWEWDELCEEAFQLAKQSLASSRVLVHYDPTMPLKLAGDASEYGVGAVLSHVCPDGSERPVAFASRTLSSSERNYAQLEKEALSLIFGVRKFHQYLYGRPFTLYTDHKPLTTILGSKAGIPTLAAARLQRWALLLSTYQYNIEYRSTACHANADGLSRLPLQSTGEEEDVTAATVFNVAQLESLPVTAEQLRVATGCDQILGKVLLLTQKGWPTKVNDDLKPYWIRRDEITIESGCLLWGVRVLVPKKLQGRVLEELHKGHPGASRIKSLARGYLWWPGLDTELEHLAKSCIPCQEVKLTPPAAPLHPWVWPSLPWQRIHVDFAGPFLGQQFLIVVDAHSKWPEVIPMASSTTAARTIEALRLLFASYGVPNQLVSDNGPQFVSKEFADFMAGNAVKHIRVAPYHPASNGLAERFVQTFKKAMSAARNDGASLSQKLCRFLLTYRSTPHATTQVAPCELFLKRTIRTRLDAIRPNYSGTVCDKQALQKELHDRHARSREFEIGQKVMAKNFLQGPPWVAGVISECKGPLTYLVEVEPHVFWRRHVDHIKHRHEAESVTPTEDDHSITYEDSLPENSAKDASNEKKVTEKLPSPDSKLLPSHQAVQEPVVPVVVEPDDGKTDLTQRLPDKGSMVLERLCILDLTQRLPDLGSMVLVRLCILDLTQRLPDLGSMVLVRLCILDLTQRLPDLKELHDRHARSREFEIGQKVMAKNFLQGPPWVAGVISECKGPLTYLVEVEPHVFWRRRVDHIKHRHEAESVTPTEDDHSITYEDSLPENSAKDASNEKKVTEKLPSPDSKLLPSHQAVQEPVVPVVVEPDDGKTGFRFAIDRGGTFTDVYAECPNGQVRIIKLLSEDPGKYADAPREAIRRILEEELGRPFPKSEALDSGHIEWGVTKTRNGTERHGIFRSVP
eukprot:Em0003g251a